MLKKWNNFFFLLSVRYLPCRASHFSTFFKKRALEQNLRKKMLLFQIILWREIQTQHGSDQLYSFLILVVL